MTDTVGGPEPDPEFEAQFAQLVRDVQAGRPALMHEPSARARMLQHRWREEPPPTTPWRGDAPTFGDATAEASRAHKLRQVRAHGVRRLWLRRVVIAVIVGALVFAIVQTNR